MTHPTAEQIITLLRDALKNVLWLYRGDSPDEEAAGQKAIASANAYLARPAKPMRSADGILPCPICNCEVKFYRCGETVDGQILGFIQHTNLIAECALASITIPCRWGNIDRFWNARAIACKPEEGWKLVPIKPTRKMIDTAVHYGDSEGYGRVSEMDAEMIWEDMIAASPNPPDDT